MSYFISSFIVGFEKVISDILPKYLPKVRIIRILEGLIYYQYDGNVKDVKKIVFFNNTFFVIKEFLGENLNFKNMSLKTEKMKLPHLEKKKTFRIRFSRENQFEKVDKDIVNRLETYIMRETNLKKDRLNPDTEFWYIIRSENVGYFGQLLKKRRITEKNLNKGELRPELAFLMCSFAKIEKDDFICDPFAGFGSIPIQAQKHFEFQHFVASDIDTEKTNRLKKIFVDDTVSVKCIDVVNLKNVCSQSIDIIITDPPWGYYENIPDIVAFYQVMFTSFRKCLSPNGIMIIASARKQELEQAAKNSCIEVLEKINTLVNGKKASIYKMKFSD